MAVPQAPKIYHIVHVDKLPSIIADDHLWCDAEVVRRHAGGTTIGMSNIKQRRLELPVDCHPGDCVGHYVPFYFCFRSVMLYLIYRANHPELDYRGGQEPIVHLEADLHQTVTWSEANNRRWAFSLSNAGAAYAEFRSDLGQLGEVNWNAVAARHWQPSEIKDGKQAEFLIHHRFPWHLVSRIGVYSRPVYDQVRIMLQATAHRPQVDIRPDWYY
jgi:ssDNA thymidine ADP-ribosyltransferase, DarT